MIEGGAPEGVIRQKVPSKLSQEDAYALSHLVLLTRSKKDFRVAIFGSPSKVGVGGGRGRWGAVSR